MRYATRRAARTGRLLALAVSAAALGACSDGPLGRQARVEVPSTALQAIECEVSVESGMRCTPAAPATGDALGVQIGKQGTHVQLSSSNAGYDSQTGIFSVDVTVQNLLNEAIGTMDGVTPDPEGIMVYFAVDPYATTGSGDVDVDNETGQAFFTGPNQAYFTYNQVLQKNEVSAPMTWRFAKPAGVTGFRFVVYVETEVQPLLVLNEVMVNPPPTVDTLMEWVEVYNAGSLPVQMQGLFIADSAASGRRPYHEIASPLAVEPGGYVVLGNRTDPAINGGAPVDYAYGNSLAIANSLDAIKISRLIGPGDTATLDRTQFSNASISAQSGISRELKNPALDNSNMDGSNWGNASVTSVYGDGGRGTPKAQNSVYTP